MANRCGQTLLADPLVGLLVPILRGRFLSIYILSLGLPPAARWELAAADSGLQERL